MNVLLWLFSTCGLIFGPAIMLAGLVALGLCLLASRRASPPRSRRNAFFASLLPLVVAVCGALVGLVLWLALGYSSGSPLENGLALGQVCLAGLVVSFLPLLWSVLLLRLRGA